MSRGRGTSNLVTYILTRLRQITVLYSRHGARKGGRNGRAFGDIPAQRLQGRPEYKLRVGDYRVLYEFDAKLGRIYLHYVGHRREIYKRS